MNQTMSDHLFSKFDLGQVLRNHQAMAQKEIDLCGEDYLLNASETDLVAFVVSKVSLDVPQLGEAYMLEDLGSSNGVDGNKHVVERIQESNLDGFCAFGNRSVGVVRVDDLGNIGWQRGGGGHRLSGGW